jgi:hypothetical protein
MVCQIHFTSQLRATLRYTGLWLRMQHRVVVKVPTIVGLSPALLCFFGYFLPMGLETPKHRGQHILGVALSPCAEPFVAKLEVWSRRMASRGSVHMGHMRSGALSPNRNCRLLQQDAFACLGLHREALPIRSHAKWT